MSPTDAIKRIMSCTEIDQQDNVQRQLLEVIPERFWEVIADTAEDKQEKSSKVKLFSLDMDDARVALTFWDKINRPKTAVLSIEPR